MKQCKQNTINTSFIIKMTTLKTLIFQLKRNNFNYQSIHENGLNNQSRNEKHDLKGMIGEVKLNGKMIT